MINVITFVITFTIIFITYLVIYNKKKKNNTLKDLEEFIILKKKFKVKNINYNESGIIIVFANSLIISLSGTIASMISFGPIWQIITGFSLLCSLMIIFYTLYAKYLNRKK